MEGGGRQAAVLRKADTSNRQVSQLKGRLLKGKAGGGGEDTETCAV